MSYRPALVTTVHDPDRRLLSGLQAVGTALARYGERYAFMTENTHGGVIDALHRAGVKTHVGPAGSAGAGQRRVLEEAVRAGHEEVFACDFDRWLHWAGSYPDELAKLPERAAREHAEAWYICLGRSERALATHPMAQSLPEEITNRALTTIAGRRLDATSGASWIRLEGARLILAGSTAHTKATDLEWPGLVMREARDRVEGMILEGLEFETADAYAREIEAAGSLEAWIHDTYDQLHVLRNRAQLAADSITALMRVTGEG